MPMITQRKHGQKQKKGKNIFMTKPGDSQTKKTLHELAKEFPDKTYRELEKYRDADRQEEAEKIPLTESQKSQEELEPIAKGVCITAALKKDRTYPDLTEGMPIENEKLKKRAHDAEGETSIVKAIGTNSPEMKELKARVKELDNSLAIALEINESHQRYNGKLQTRVTDLEEDNKKLAHQVEDIKMNSVRKAGL